MAHTGWSVVPKVLSEDEELAYLNKGFLTPKRAAEFLGVTGEELLDFVRKGRLRQFRDRGNVIYKATDLETLKTQLATPAN